MTLSRRSFLKVAGLTAVSVVGASMFTGCGSSPIVTIVYVASDSTNNNLVAAVKKLNGDKTKTTFLALSWDKKYVKQYVQTYLPNTVDIDEGEGKTTYKTATEGDNKGKLVIYIKAKG